MLTLADLRLVLERVAELPAADRADAIGLCAAAQARLFGLVVAPMAPPTETAEVVDVATLAAELGLAPSWLRAQARGGKLPHLRCGKYIKFRRADVLAALARDGTDHRMGSPGKAENANNGAARFPLVSI